MQGGPKKRSLSEGERDHPYSFVSIQENNAERTADAEPQRMPDASPKRDMRTVWNHLLVAPQDLATAMAPSVICLLPSEKSQIASTPSSDSINARDSS